MNTSDFMFELPDDRIAQTPTEPRDHSRLLVVERGVGVSSDRRFYDLPEYLRPGDALVINETKVIPARLIGERENGGECELLLLKQLSPKRWETLARPGRRIKPGARLSFGGGRLEAVILSETDAGGRVVEFICEGPFEAALNELGEMPLPPYIREKLSDGQRYQTVYARREGSAAAPTAGLHFTDELLDRIRAAEVDIIPILLNVGLGTFRPVKVERIEEHQMHSEFYEISEDSAARINSVRQRGGRVIAVGTTSVRTLESAAVESGIVAAGSNWTDIFIRPGYEFKVVDGMVTNFHLPGSTLIMLVAAFAGLDETLAAYHYAVGNGYRFYSFGDAMLIV